MAESRGTVVSDRTVFVYEDPWPAGLVTGYPDAGGFVIEAVVAFRPGALRAMRTTALQCARDRGYEHLRCRLPKAFPMTPRLRQFAERAGFTVYHEDNEWVDLAWYP